MNSADKDEILAQFDEFVGNYMHENYEDFTKTDRGDIKLFLLGEVSGVNNAINTLKTILQDLINNKNHNM